MTTPVQSLRSALYHYDNAREWLRSFPMSVPARENATHVVNALAESARALLNIACEKPDLADAVFAPPCEGLCKLHDVELTQMDCDRVAKMLERYAPNGGAFRVAIKRIYLP